MQKSFKKIALLSVLVSSSMILTACSCSNNHKTSKKPTQPHTAPMPSVATVNVDKFEVGSLATFNIVGENLTNDVKLSVANCQGLTKQSGTTTNMVFSCTPSVAGEQMVIIMDSQNKVLFSQKLQVSEKPVVVVAEVTKVVAEGLKVGELANIQITGKNFTDKTTVTFEHCEKLQTVSKTANTLKLSCTPTMEGKKALKILDDNKVIFTENYQVNDTSTPLLPVTGITLCNDESKSNIACNSLSSAWLGLMQDGEVQAGQKMSYTTLNQNGAECVRDNVTGLIWEQKTDDGGLRDKDNTYTWYNPDNRTNGGYEGSENGDKNTDQYIQELNASNYCGYSDWRLPTFAELDSIVDYGRVNPAINPIFTNTQSNFYWSSSPYAYRAKGAWGVYFSYGYAYYDFKNLSYYVRAVRSESR